MHGQQVEGRVAGKRVPRTRGGGIVALIGLTICGCAAHRPLQVPVAQAAVVVSGTAREALPNDYLRVSFLPADVKVTSLGRPGALRAFVTATPLYAPPLKLADLPAYSGLVNNDANVLVAMRCRPPQPEKVDAVLASWPNVFAAIQRDVPVDATACNGQPPDPATQMACYARAFSDPPSAAVPASLAHAFSYAGALYDGQPQHTALANWLQSNYGIFPAFAGTGYSVKDSYYLDKQPMTAQQILAKSVSSEYVLKNVSLADAGCRCISVASYTGRSADPLDPNFIEQAGGAGECKAVPKLQTGRKK
ncbi:hypothetical protein [Occallatibacter riparius]|uniref:Uncharacterized protein n=1 Tax=Occallatibacter riparius TaxID=1002689 RepID=A0A9J7BVH2_9BACT|nr:hypothetical protein [Occallatibacter riparius]UWZ86876.1 hypothetical protein MOP44_13220 [Occallatibacter riparius]